MRLRLASANFAQQVGAYADPAEAARSNDGGTTCDEVIVDLADRHDDGLDVVLMCAETRRKENPMSKRKLHKELDEMHKLLAVLIEVSGGQVVIAERAFESLPDDVEIWRDELPDGFRLRTIRPNKALRAEVEEQVEKLDEAIRAAD